MFGASKMISLAGATTSGAAGYHRARQCCVWQQLTCPRSAAIAALPARACVDLWIVKMLPNAAGEGDIAHGRRFYDREIAEIFSG